MPKRDNLKDDQKNTKTANQQQEKSRDGKAKHHQNKIEPTPIKQTVLGSLKKGMKRREQSSKKRNSQQAARAITRCQA